MFNWIKIDVSVSLDVAVERPAGSEGSGEVDSSVLPITLLSQPSEDTKCGAVNTGQTVSLRWRRVSKDYLGQNINHFFFFKIP